MDVQMNFIWSEFFSHFVPIYKSKKKKKIDIKREVHMQPAFWSFNCLFH